MYNLLDMHMIYYNNGDISMDVLEMLATCTRNSRIKYT